MKAERVGLTSAQKPACINHINHEAWKRAADLPALAFEPGADPHDLLKLDHTILIHTQMIRLPANPGLLSGEPKELLPLLDQVLELLLSDLL